MGARNVKLSAAVLAAIVVPGVAAVALVAGISMAPTRGRPIGPYPSPRAALLVIDVQEDYTGPAARSPFPYQGSDSLIARINRLVARAQETDMVIAYAGQEYPDQLGFRLAGGGRSISGKPGTRQDARLNVVNGNYFPKSRSDAFSNPAFSQFLINNQVNEVYLCGLDAAYCVMATARGGRNRGYAVTVIGDAVVTRPGKRLGDIFERYEKHGIKVMAEPVFSAGR